MDFEQALVYELQSISSLKGKIYPSNAKEDVKPPFLVYISSDGEKIMTLTGPTDLTETSCEIHILTETYEQLKSISRAVIDLITSFFQRKIGIDGPGIKSITYTEPTEEIDNNLNYHRCSFDIRIRY